MTTNLFTQIAIVFMLVFIIIGLIFGLMFGSDFIIQTIKKQIIKYRQKKSFVLNYKPADLDFNVLKLGDIKFYWKETKLNQYTGQPMVMTFESNFVPFKTAQEFIKINEKYFNHDFITFDNIIFDHKYKNDIFSIKTNKHNHNWEQTIVLTIANLPVLENYIKEKNKTKTSLDYCFENIKWHNFC